MGKKGRRTRWRTLTITDEHSDSEESNTTTSGHRVPKGYPQKSYYSRFTYSSQSTPTRRYQCDGTKSTRSSSTASENKITFNEDEYTRITTPRQDVLFKKGYLNKPKTYQTQTSTGNSTTSTGNSTGNGTPDHQSTDLEYESQFVFPNGFVDQNGIYYVNSFEPYPVMVYNPPTYYPEYTSVKSKRCSTGSLTESTSPNNEETSQSETPSNVSEMNHVYNVIYPGFYYNGALQPQDAVNQPEPRRVRKRRRRKPSRSKEEGSTSESSDEVFSDEEEEEETKSESPAKVAEETEGEEALPEETTSEKADEATCDKVEETVEEDAQKEELKSKYDLKPDAEEFVPRAYRHPESIPMEANVQFIKIPSNFVPVPILNPMGDFNAFIPTGIPINFIPQNYVNFVPYKHPVQQTDEKQENKEEEVKETVEVPKNQIDIAKIVSKLEEAAKEQDETAVKEETQNRNVPKKRQKYQKVELRKPQPNSEPKEWKKWKQPQNSPKKEETSPKPIRNYSDTLKKSMAALTSERHDRNSDKMKINRTPTKEAPKNHQRMEKTQLKMPNEWIAVSRKKRKNRSVEENEPFDDVVVDEQIEEVSQIEEVLEIVEAPAPPPPPLETKPEEIKEEKKPKKKSKKSHVKATPPPITKRVIIKDIDLSEEVKKVEELTPVEESKPVEEPKVEEQVVEEVEETIVEAVEETIVEAVEEKKESPEKKSKKKKKKVLKMAILSSQSSSSATLNVNDDSYDFLLDESLEKTNVEVSQELDKMIQRGMYSSLEEKIKSMNMESDNFFKTVINNISSRESSVEKNPYIKSPDLSKLLTTTPLLKAKPYDRSDFLVESTTPELIEGGDEISAPKNDNLYPITKAVKEWMTKTRETTPDVELLKSPSTIFREFGDDVDLERKTSVSSVEEAEDVLETYEDFPKQAEVEEVKGNYPKHGNLPYRAICCSIM